MSTKVVHCKKQPYDVYIAHPSEWENPFSIGVDGDRLEVIRMFEEYLQRRIQNGAVTVERLAKLHGKKLGCWCYPHACHGEVLVAYAEWAHNQLNEKDAA
jgi:hypothetical protein